MAILHHIKANLYENLLTEDPNDYVARVITERTLNVAEICTSAVSRGGADVPAASMEHGVNLFLKEMAYQLCDGYSVNTGFFTATTQVKGVFNSPTETFTPGKHYVQFLFNQGDKLRSELPSIGVDIQGVAESGLVITQAVDVKTGSVNEKLTPNRNLKIKGYKLKLAGDNATVGVYFVNQATGLRTRVDNSDVVTNNPSELIVVTPQLQAGEYNLEVTTQFSGAALLKEPRTASLDKVLVVTI